jgi:cell division protein FtsQ
LIRSRANRRKRDRRLARWRLPSLSLPKISWRILAVPPILAGALYGVLLAVEIALDQPVRNLVVEGTFQRVTPIQVEAALSDELKNGFFTVNLARMREAVAALDWVDRVKIRRAWPDTLIVQITEHQAAARWNETGLLNVRGELFTDRSPHPFPELPQLIGPPGTEKEVARRYLALRGRLAEAELTLESLTLDERGAWSIKLAGGQEIRLGRRDVDERLYRFFEVVAPALAADFARVDYVDLRYTNGFAVGWNESAPTAVAVREEGRGRG